MPKLSKKQREVLQNIGDHAIEFSNTVREELEELRRNKGCQTFKVITYDVGGVEINQDDDFILLRTKKDVRRLIKELEDALKK